MEKTTIRRSAYDDIEHLKEIFAHARRFMKETGNPNQWDESYPDEYIMRDDIKRGDSYVVTNNGEIAATFVIREGDDPTYATIYEGRWPDNKPYATIHRMAGNGKTKGILHLAMEFARQSHSSIRIDTHRDNMVMRRAIEKEGFRYCGIIHCHNGEERMAYQWTRQELAEKTQTTMPQDAGKET